MFNYDLSWITLPQHVAYTNEWMQPTDCITLNVILMNVASPNDSMWPTLANERSLH